MSKSEKNIKDITFLNLLGLAFIVLKLCGVIDWYWVIILFPIYFEHIPDFIIFLIKTFRFLINVSKELFSKKV
jgi:hypothetical protein